MRDKWLIKNGILDGRGKPHGERLDDIHDCGQTGIRTQENKEIK